MNLSVGAAGTRTGWRRSLCFECSNPGGLAIPPHGNFLLNAASSDDHPVWRRGVDGPQALNEGPFSRR